ncbi:FH2 domain-containing protein 1-like isoform X2 [Phyllopteryx taeniolatus]|uniref:FH2 domain-containing protein 1-like isoform X2 n=1 Tax=Phyllopteryx taeniolatus TaxID=161469 RepID=UPI002AD29C97|nr:FH2 domain-containing protein 1-like isoform X2 [Phyllopteryx taeniolatus]
MRKVKKMKAYNGDVSKLSLADSFVFLLIQLPSYATRIECMLAKEEIPGMCEAMRAHIGILRSATKEVLGCQELHAILHLVLQAGNILNAGGHGGNAAGFKLSSLLSLADTKANKPGMNLLHFVALEAQKTEEKLLDFPLKLNHVQAASRISLETLDAELQRQTSRTRTLEESVRTDGELLQQLDGFLQDATARMCALRDSRQLLSKEAGELMDFFCEDSDTFRLDECFSVLHGFCCKFSHAVKENKDREARRNRLQVLEEQKRHSWAGGEEVGGAVGFQCRSETDLSEVMLRQDEASVLLELLSPKSNGWRASRRHTVRSRHSSSQSPSSPSGNTATTTTPLAANLDCHVNVDTASDYDDSDRDHKEASMTPPELRHCKTSSEDDRGNHDILAAANDNNNIVFLLEKCSLVPVLKSFGEVGGPARLCEVTAADAEEPRASDESMGAKAAVSWCVTAVCEADHPGEKEPPSVPESASFPEPAQSAPVCRQPPPTSTLCVSSEPPPQSDQRKKAGSSRTVATSTNGIRSNHVRTLNSSEKQNMRRVVPISRTNREKRGEKPSTAPPSRCSNLQPRDSKNRHVPGARNQSEEKMCRSTLRALGGGSTVKAPNTRSPAPLSGPGFARSTASSSFRQTRAGLPRANVFKSGSETSSKSSTSAEQPRTSSSLSSSLPKRTPSIRTPPSISATQSSRTPPSVRTSPNTRSHLSVRTSTNISAPPNNSTPPNVRPRSSVKTSANIRTPPTIRTPPSVRTSAKIRTPPIIRTPPSVRTSAKISTPPNNSTPPNVRPRSSVKTSANIKTPPIIRTPPSVRTSAKIRTPPIIRTPPSVRTTAKIRTPPGSMGPDSVAPAKDHGHDGSFSDKSSQSRHSVKVSKPSWR